MNIKIILPLFLLSFILMATANLMAGDPIEVTITDDQEICYGATPDTLKSRVTGGSGNYTYLWQSSLDGDTWNIIPGADDSIFVPPPLYVTTAYRLIVDDDVPTGRDTSNIVTIRVYDELLANTITGGITPICYGDDAGTLYSHASGGAGGHVIKWYNENNVYLFTGPVFPVGILLATTRYYYIVEDDECGSDTSSIFSCTVYPQLTAGNITGGNSPICAGDNGGTLTANATGGSGNYSIKWYNEAGNQLGTGETYNVGTLNITTSYYYIVTDVGADCGSKTSASLQIEVVDFITASILITPSPPNICSGDQVSFTAMPTPPNQLNQYQWFINDEPSGNGQVMTTDEILENATVKVLVIYPEGTCVTNNPATGTYDLTVRPIPDTAAIISKPLINPVVLIYPGDTTGMNYSYQWYLNGQIITGATSKYYYHSSGLSYGTYTVRVTNQYLCYVELSYDHGLDKSGLFSKEDIFMIFPNPNQGEFMIILNDDVVSTNSYIVRITDINGRVKYHETLPAGDRSVRLTGFSKGIYLLELTLDDKQQQCRKLVVY
ncbi:MAG: T9SS type A sorting domain-containing protein [Bacteroidales bacterium]|nr:T9SS type A sorting domain-containing protein [Bacteroidales bacterium]